MTNVMSRRFKVGEYVRYIGDTYICSVGIVVDISPPSGGITVRWDVWPSQIDDATFSVPTAYIIHLDILVD